MTACFFSRSHITDGYTGVSTKKERRIRLVVRRSRTTRRTIQYRQPDKQARLRTHRCCRFARALVSSDSRHSSFSLGAGETLLLHFNFVSPMELFATLCNCKYERHIPDSSLTEGRCIYQLHRFRGFYGGNAANGVGWYYSGTLGGGRRTHHLRRCSRRAACGFRAPAV